ncbi:putative sensor domain DACNV-containing protein [Geobacter sp. DSM 9736]|uniref:putative sensor domain DACNV-containing protein n=1 Tax=Geobacter sp. DSM 9736 TaxID=1277350 RepID=UPI000B50A690|nr:diadenylate cyclase [Geobacter sp. DSM 9736]SNB46726.1 DisA checkpoint controller nucleotide-binding [Geobacter sp. DSM 9736]
MRFVLAKWPSVDEETGEIPEELPDQRTLQRLLSICYQASLLREEERTVDFRLILREPSLFPAEEGTPDGLHRLIFTQPRPFNEYELQRLSPAVDFYRSLIGVRFDPILGLQMWGIVHSGPRWMQSVFGGRRTAAPLPPALVVYVAGPGRIAVCRGSEIVASLNGGKITRASRDVFNAPWLRASFDEVRSELYALHQKARAQASSPWAVLAPDFVRKLVQQVVKRIIGSIRNSHHGGTLVYLPEEQAAALCCDNQFMSIKYQFVEEEPRQRLRTLIVNIMNAFAEAAGSASEPDRVVGWEHYILCRSEKLALLDEALFDVAHLIAGFASIDGAVVISKRQELLGFGAVISGDIDKVEAVARAMDVEGSHTMMEGSERVGTRHRAAYRLCHDLHDAIVIVLSHDGSARLVTWHQDKVTYWDQITAGVAGF